MNVIAISNSLYHSTGLLSKLDFDYILRKEDLTEKYLRERRPDYVFFPHWSYLIRPEIYENFNCVIFHMTDLPFGRGGSPLQNLIQRGIGKTKISAIRCVKQVDGGDVYLKRDFDISRGSAAEIYSRAGEVISLMIDEIVEKHPVPVPQKGEVIEFKRRTPDQSDMSEVVGLNGAYNHIRMLDAVGYPKAFIEEGELRYEFSNAVFEHGKLTATVEILRRS